MQTKPCRLYLSNVIRAASGKKPNSLVWLRGHVQVEPSESPVVRPRDHIVAARVDIKASKLLEAADELL